MDPQMTRPAVTSSVNPWAYKPWWCQPWSIVLTGCSVIGGSWWLFQRVWVTGLVAVPILLWMGFFLLIWPRWMAQLLAEAATQESEQSRP